MLIGDVFFCEDMKRAITSLSGLMEIRIYPKKVMGELFGLA